MNIDQYIESFLSQHHDLITNIIFGSFSDFWKQTYLSLSCGWFLLAFTLLFTSNFNIRFFGRAIQVIDVR